MYIKSIVLVSSRHLGVGSFSCLKFKCNVSASFCHESLVKDVANVESLGSSIFILASSI